jgi:hypothetical protein
MEGVAHLNESRAARNTDILTKTMFRVDEGAVARPTISM